MNIAPEHPLSAVEKHSIVPFPGTIGIYHGPLYLGPNGYETYRPYAGYIREFARHFEKVVVFAPVTSNDTDYRGSSVEFPNVRIVPLPHFDTHVQATRHVGAIRRAFKKEIDNLDVINCRNTAPFGSMLYFLGRRRSIGFFYEFTSNPWQILTAGTKYLGLRGFLSRMSYLAAFQVQKHVMRNAYCFIDGPTHYDYFAQYTKNIESLICSTLENDDFNNRRDNALHSPVRLLYIGYLKHMKGLDYLVESLSKIRANGINAKVHFVGDGPMADELRTQARSLNVETQCHFHGFVADAKTLHRHIDECDIFVFPSLSEGSPRVVLEALARSIPMISTPVGSVPDMLTDGQNTLIVPFRDSAAIANAVARLVQNDKLRTDIARNGYEIARQYTVETFVGRMAEKAKELARKRTPK